VRGEPTAMPVHLTLIRLIGGSREEATITARRAALAIGAVTVFVTVASGIAMRWVDHTDFDSVWLGLWWAVQTVTTVGYGDTVPTTSAGKFLATLVMVVGIGFIAVVTAAITAAFIESARRRLAADAVDPLEDPTSDQLDEVLKRLERLEALLSERPNR
jgi:voltage-gated potassium channel